MNVRDCTIELFLKSGKTRNIKRMVKNAKLTGYVTRDWGGDLYRQWVGIIHYDNQEFKVWGYSHGEQYVTPPEKWSNDTF